MVLKFWPTLAIHFAGMRSHFAMLPIIWRNISAVIQRPLVMKRATSMAVCCLRPADNHP